MTDIASITRKLVAEGFLLPVARPRAKIKPKPSEAQLKALAAAREIHRQHRREKELQRKLKRMTMDKLQRLGFTIREIAEIKGMELDEVKAFFMGKVMK